MARANKFLAAAARSRNGLASVLTVVLCATLVFIGAAVPAQADIIVSYPTSAPIPATTTDWSSSVPLQLFDPSLGTLQSVDIYVSSTLNTTLTVQNTDESDSSSGSAKTEVQVTVDGNPALDFLSPAFSYTLGPGGSTSSGLLTSSSSLDSGPLTDAPTLSAFTGVGTMDLYAYTFTQTDLSNTGGNTNASQVTDASFTATVTYDYIATPEPGSIVLMGLGAAGLFCIARRRKG